MIARTKEPALLVVAAWLAWPGACGAFPLGGVIYEGTDVVSGVTVFAGTNSVVSDTGGNYLFTNLAGSFFVTPTQGASYFNPARRTLVMQTGLTNVNFERGASNYTTLVTTCDATSLVAAITNAGTIGFDCDGTIVFSNYFTITNKTFSIDAGSRDVTIDGGNTTRFLRVWSATCRVANLTFTRCRAPPEKLDGFFETNLIGGVFLVYRAALDVNRCTFISNACLAGSLSSSNVCAGGAIHVINASLSASNSSFIANRAESGTAHGGAIYNAQTLQLREIRVDRCLFDRNSVRCNSSIDSIFFQAMGGAIYSEAVTRTTLLHVANSTFVSNFARDVSGDFIHGGNAINNTAGSRLDLTNCTFVHNFNGSNEFQFALNSFLTTSTVRGCIFQSGGTNNEVREANGIIWDLGFNFIRRDTSPTVRFSNTTSRVITNALLTELGDHGGPTRTIALQAGSPHIDAITNGTSIDVDQRGALRPNGTFSDVGAFEDYPTTFVFAAFSATGASGTAQPVTEYRLQTSTNLADWIDVQTNETGADGSFGVTNAAAQVQEQLFYRTSWP